MAEYYDPTSTRLIGGLKAPGGSISQAFSEGMNNRIGQRDTLQAMRERAAAENRAATEFGWKGEDRARALKAAEEAKRAAAAAAARNAAYNRAIRSGNALPPAPMLDTNRGPLPPVPVDAPPPRSGLRFPTEAGTPPAPPVSGGGGATAQQGGAGTDRLGVPMGKTGRDNRTYKRGGGSDRLGAPTTGPSFERVGREVGAASIADMANTAAAREAMAVPPGQSQFRPAGAAAAERAAVSSGGPAFERGGRSNTRTTAEQVRDVTQDAAGGLLQTQLQAADWALGNIAALGTGVLGASSAVTGGTASALGFTDFGQTLLDQSAQQFSDAATLARDGYFGVAPMSTADQPTQPSLDALLADSGATPAAPGRTAKPGPTGPTTEHSKTTGPVSIQLPDGSTVDFDLGDDGTDYPTAPQANLTFGPQLGAVWEKEDLDLTSRIMGIAPGEVLPPVDVTTYVMQPGKLVKDTTDLLAHREELARLAAIAWEYEQFGDYDQYYAQIEETDRKLYELQVAQGLEELEYGSPHRAEAALSIETPYQHTIQRNNVGTYDIFLDGQFWTRMDRTQLMDYAQSKLNDAYAAKQAERADKEFDTRLEIEKTIAIEGAKTNYGLVLAGIKADLETQQILLRSSIDPSNVEIVKDDATGTIHIWDKVNQQYVGTIEQEESTVPNTGEKVMTPVFKPRS